MAYDQHKAKFGEVYRIIKTESWVVPLVVMVVAVHDVGNGTLDYDTVIISPDSKTREFSQQWGLFVGQWERVDD